MPGKKTIPKHCFICGRRFPSLEDIFSEDGYTNGYCKPCTMILWGGEDNFEDHALTTVIAVCVEVYSSPNAPQWRKDEES